MNRLSNGTEISSFSPGQPLSSSIMNKLNSTINNNTSVANSFLKEYINPNIEENNFTTTYSLETLISTLPVERRIPGIKLRFLGSDGWEEYVFCSTDISKWNNVKFWKANDQAGIIDGGEW